MVRRYVRLLLSQIVGEETWSTARTHGYRRSLAWTVLPLDLGAREPFHRECFYVTGTLLRQALFQGEDDGLLVKPW